MASSSPKDDVIKGLCKIKLDKNFPSEIVKSSFDLSNGKPNPDIYINTAKDLGVKRDCCVVLEDSEIGVRAAKQAGMKCIAVPNDFTNEQDFTGADYRVDSLIEAKKRLEALYSEGK